MTLNIAATAMPPFHTPIPSRLSFVQLIEGEGVLVRRSPHAARRISTYAAFIPRSGGQGQQLEGGGL